MKSLLILSSLVVALFLFPRVWYTKTDGGQVVQWLLEQTNAPGWRFEPISVDASAEKLLVADKLMNGAFKREGGGGEVIRVFGARRFKEDPKEIGLFVHTPDRCWVQAGWGLGQVDPDHVEVEVHGRRILFERRIFSVPGQRELVYFAGLVAGQTLPYRLDHNYSVSRRVVEAGKTNRRMGASRWNDSLLWRRLWESFASRRPLLGPKQFLRISTAIDGENVEVADARLREMLPLWLKPEDAVAAVAGEGAGR